MSLRDRCVVMGLVSGCSFYAMSGSPRVAAAGVAAGVAFILGFAKA